MEENLALEGKAAARGKEVQLPLVIMTSRRTHDRTQSLLQENNNFGAATGQITLLQQEEVSMSLVDQGIINCDVIRVHMCWKSRRIHNL